MDTYTLCSSCYRFLAGREIILFSRKESNPKEIKEVSELLGKKSEYPQESVEALFQALDSATAPGFESETCCATPLQNFEQFKIFVDQVPYAIDCLRSWEGFPVPSESLLDSAQLFP